MLTLQELALLHITKEEENLVNYIIDESQEDLFERVIDTKEMRYILLHRVIMKKLAERYFKKWLLSANLRLRALINVDAMLLMANKGENTIWWCKYCDQFGAKPVMQDGKYAFFVCYICRFDCLCGEKIYSQSYKGLHGVMECPVCHYNFGTEVDFKHSNQRLLNGCKLYKWFV